MLQSKKQNKYTCRRIPSSRRNTRRVAVFPLGGVVICVSPAIGWRPIQGVTPGADPCNPTADKQGEKLDGWITGKRCLWLAFLL